jgi:hypothetical protein
MTPAQRKVELKKANEAMVAEMESRLREAHSKGSRTSPLDDGSAAPSVSALLMVLAIWPLICAGLSMAAAFKTASGGVSG